jgi:DMSO/TMAO reductase YedYZ molybdopterin-dependent catalytic subunit
MSGAQSVTVSPEYFARGASIHAGSYTDSQGVSWTGIPLWYLVGFADDTTGSASGHGGSAFNDALADSGYTITVSGSSGSVTLDSRNVKRSSAYLVANKKAGADTAYTLVGTGAGIGSGVQGVSSISLSLGSATPTPTPTVTPAVTSNLTATTADWNISVEGKMNKLVTRSWFEGGITAGHTGTWQDADGKTWQGMPLWYFAGLADDEKQHGSGAFSDAAATEGYTITVYGKDGKSVTLDSKKVARSGNYLIANWMNGAPIPTGDANAPIALVGQDISGSKILGGVTRIVLTFPGTEEGTATTGTSTDAGNASRKAPDGGTPGSPAGSLVNSTGPAGGSVIPTFTVRITFTPFPEIVIQYGQPGLTAPAASAPGGTEKTDATGSRTQAPPADELALRGAISDTVSVQKVVDGIAYGHKAEFTDPEGTTWTGMPLWFFAGWVDDENAHSAGAFNDEVARNGYNITVTGINGETVIGSTDAMRSDGFIIATTRNGERLTTENGGPLMLVGSGVPQDYQVTGVSAITLDLPSRE